MSLLVTLGLSLSLAGAPFETPRSPAPADTGLDRLRRQIVQLFEPAKATLGLHLIHLETGRSLSIKPDERFFMASTHKIAIAIELLALVDHGRIRLDSLVPLQTQDVMAFGGTLAEQFRDSAPTGLAFPVQRYLELMMNLSDNTATDIVLRLVGGPANVTKRIHQLGVADFRIDRNTVELTRDLFGIDLPPYPERSPAALRNLLSAAPRERQVVFTHAFYADDRDTSTPRAMAQLFLTLVNGKAVSPASTELLLGIMSRTDQMGARLGALLPPETSFARKGGSHSGPEGTALNVANDVSIMTLPNVRGRVITAVFLKHSPVPQEQRVVMIRQLLRAVYDYFSGAAPW